MNYTCRNCNRTLYIDEDDIRRYNSAQDRARDIELRNINLAFDNSIVATRIKDENYSQANFLRNSVSNPFICPYCGEDVRRTRIKVKNRNAIEKYDWEEFYGRLCTALLILFSLVFIFYRPLATSLMGYYNTDWDIGYIALLPFILYFGVVTYCYISIISFSRKAADDLKKKKEDELEKLSIKKEYIKKFLLENPNYEFETNKGVKFNVVLDNDELYALSNGKKRKFSIKNSSYSKAVNKIINDKRINKKMN